MADLTPTPGWDPVPQLETTTLALGGPGGPMNSQAQALLNRTEHLKAAVEAGPPAGTVTDESVAPDAGIQSSKLAFTPAGTGAVTRTVRDKMRDVIHSADYATLQQAINAAYGKKLIVTGTHVITSELTITDSIEIDMAPDAVIDFSGAPSGASLSAMRAIRIHGSIAAGVAVTADVPVDATQISLLSTTSFAPGDLVILRSNEPFMPGFSGANVSRGHITRVKTVDSGTLLTLTEKSPFAYAASSNARLEKITPVSNVTIRGGLIVGGGVGKVHNGIYAYAAENLTIEGVRIKGCEDTGVQASFSVNVKVKSCVIEDSTSPGGAIGNTGYGAVFYAGTRDSQMVGNVFRRCRHAVAGGGTIISLYCDVLDNVAEDCGIGTQALDCHEPCFWWKFSGNYVSGGHGGIVARGQYISIIGNTIRGTDGRGILVRQFYTNPNGVSGAVVANNSISGCNGGILLEGSDSTQKVIGATVKGNSIMNCGLYGIEAIYVRNVTISDNVVRGVTSNAGLEGSAIRISGALPGDNLNVCISDNILANTLRHGIFAQFVERLSISGNNVEQVATAIAGSPIHCQQCTDININGGQSYADLPGNGAVITIESCNRVTVSGHRMKGNAANASQDGIRAYNNSGTSSVLIVNGCVVEGCGRYGVYTTNTDRVIVTNSDLRDVTSATKINISGATTSVNANNIT